MKRILAALAALALVGCGGAGPKSLDDMMEWDACPVEWKIVPPDTAGCSNPRLSIQYSNMDELTWDFAIAAAQDAATFDGCWMVTNRKHWSVVTCTQALVDEAQEMWGGEVIDL